MKKYSIFIILFAFIIITEVIADKTQESSNINLVVGEQHVIDASDVASFSESVRGIIEVKIPKSGQQMILTALRPGSTSLLLIGRDNVQTTKNITVFAASPEAIIEEAKSLLKNSPGITYMVIGSRVFIDGTVETEAELSRINQIKTLYGGQLQSLVTQGSGASRTNIRLDLTFVEVSNSNSLRGGIGWPGSLGAGGSVELTYDLVNQNAFAAYEIVDQAMPSIHAAQASGWAKVRKKAHLVTISGNSATYTAGGEINVPILNAMTAGVHTIDYGATLTVLPLVNEQAGQINLQVDAEVSEIRETNQSIPGRTLSKISTLVHLGIGQSIVLSGLDSESSSLTKEGLPFLSKIPFFGMLFGTHHKRSEETTGLIAITPVLLHNVDVWTKQELDSILQKFNDKRF